MRNGTWHGDLSPRSVVNTNCTAAGAQDAERYMARRSQSSECCQHQLYSSRCPRCGTVHGRAISVLGVLSTPIVQQPVPKMRNGTWQGDLSPRSVVNTNCTAAGAQDAERYM